MSRDFRRSSVWLLGAIGLAGGVLASPPRLPGPAPSDSLTEEFLFFEIESDADDGTEVDDSVWYRDGYAGNRRNRMGAADGESYDVGLRFQAPEVQQGESFVYARVRIPATGSGHADATTRLRIVGVDQDSAPDFAVARPSQLPKTNAAVHWDIESGWPDIPEVYRCSPLHRYSPDLSPIINEIVSRRGWGSGPEGKTLAIVIEDAGCLDGDFAAFRDYQQRQPTCPGSGAISAALELYRTVRSTFVGTELLGCPTDHSVTVNAISLLTLDVYFEFRGQPSVNLERTATVRYPAGRPIEVVLDGLTPDTRYYYRMRYRRPGQPRFSRGPLRSFRTQRAPGTTFTFAVQADSHLEGILRKNDSAAVDLYRRTLGNVAEDRPDFHIALGDTFHCEHYNGRDVIDYQEAVERHLAQRPFLDLVCHSAPFFFVVGNHEGEQGWRLDGTPDNVAVWASNARKLVYPLPAPDDFYTGSTDDVEFVGPRESYYAWQWGDALFVVLDPYWYTVSKPHDRPDGIPGSGDNWDWTLGQEQYDWLCQTLEESPATFKFVFSHQVTGGVNTYGRGGIEAASHALGRCGSFEWGGEDLDGNYVFDVMRPGWSNPIHQVMVDNGVTIFFHGHDHVFVKQELDGIVYQECPRPARPAYDDGYYEEGLYIDGDKVNNSGHLRVAVSPSQVTVDYIRAYLPGDGPNGEIAYSYTIDAPPTPQKTSP